MEDQTKKILDIQEPLWTLPPPELVETEPDISIHHIFYLFGREFKIDIFLITIMINNFLLNACFSNIMPFFPQEALSKGVPEYMVGIIFAALPFGGILNSLFLAKYISKIGRKKTLIFGVLTNMFTAAILGLLKYVNNECAFIIIALASRLFQGFGRSAYSTGTFSSISVIYPNSIQKKIGYIESVSGLGMMLGPPIGSGLYSLGGYSTPFFCFAAIFVIMFPITIRNLNKLKILEKEKSQGQNILKISDFLFERRIFSIFLAIIIGNINLTYLGPTFANHLIFYGMETKYIGLIYPVGTMAYILSIKFVSSLRKNFERKILISFGLFINIIAQIMVGPQPYIFPEHISIVILSQLFLGSSLCFIFLPFIPEVNILGSKIYPNDKNSVSDMASGLFSAGVTIGGVLGPILGGVMASMLGFVYASSIFAVAVVVVFVIYLSFGDGLMGICGYLRRKNSGTEEKEVLLLLDGKDKEKNCEIRVEDSKSDEIKRINFNSTFVEEVN